MGPSTISFRLTILEPDLDFLLARHAREVGRERAATRHGISVAKPVPGERLGVMQCCHVGEDEAETPTLTEAIDAPVGIFGRAAG